jgi:hypothetical protein
MGNWVEANIVYGFQVMNNDTILCPNQLNAKWNCEWYWTSVTIGRSEEFAGVGVIYGFDVTLSDNMDLSLTPDLSLKQQQMQQVEDLRALLSAKGYTVDPKCGLHIGLWGDISHEYYTIFNI